MIEKLIWMQGKVYSTLTHNKKFTIMEVTNNKIVIRNQKGSLRTIGRDELEKPWEKLIKDKQITQQQIYDTGSRNSAYIAAILSNTIGVNGLIHPARLEFQQTE